jgi:hypothetical protein
LSGCYPAAHILTTCGIVVTAAAACKLHGVLLLLPVLLGVCLQLSSTLLLLLLLLLLATPGKQPQPPQPPLLSLAPG